MVLFHVSLQVLAQEPVDKSTTQSGPKWSEPLIMSVNTRGAWFADIAVDHRDRVHVIWEGSMLGTEIVQSGSNTAIVLSAMHTVLDNGLWSEPNDIYSDWVPSGAIYRPALAAGDLGYIYLTVKPPTQRVTLLRSTSDASYSALAWSKPELVSGGGVSYMSDVAIDSQGVIHVVWQETVPFMREDGFLLELFDIFYRRSQDGGRTWSERTNLSKTPVHEGRAQIKIDSSDSLYVAWDEGGANQVVIASGTPGKAHRGVLVFSHDGGETWSPPRKFSYPNNTNAQMAAISNGQGEVLVVWRSAEGPIYYDRSMDGGLSWSPPSTIPRITAYSYTAFDAYDMALDSAGTVHLIAAGTLSEDYPSRGIYHLAWDGSTWSAPTLIYNSEERGEDLLVGMYPKIAVSHGNQLHVVWHTHAFLSYLKGRYIWYSTSQSQAPPQDPPAILIPTPMTPSTGISTSVAASNVISVSHPLSSLPFSDFDPSVIYTENDDVLRLLVSLVPFALIIASTLIIHRVWRRR
jgi:hypothetical protein